MAEYSDRNSADRQVAWAFLRVHDGAGTPDELREQYVSAHGVDDLKDWTGVLERFTERGYTRREGETYRLTPSGKGHAEQLRGEDFGEGLVLNDRSTAYGRYCALVYGKDLGQYSMVTMEQLGALIEVLQLDTRSRVLDIGCSVGRITEYISDVTGASVTGIDFAGPAVRRAQERTCDKSGRLTFVVGSMNRLDLPAASFDSIIALDTLYFADDLRQTLEQMKTLLRAPGQMGLFWTQVAPDGAATEMLQPDRTRLATALSAAGLTFQAYDFTAAEKRLWQRAMDALEELKPAFEAEGSTNLHAERLGEVRHLLARANADRISRYLYHVRL